MDYSPQGSSVHGIFQPRILEWVSYSRGSFWPRDQTHVSCVSCIGVWTLYQCATWKAHSHNTWDITKVAWSSVLRQAECTAETQICLGLSGEQVGPELPKLELFLREMQSGNRTFITRVSITKQGGMSQSHPPIDLCLVPRDRNGCE